MFENVDTQKKNDDFEKRITQIYNKYAGGDIAEIQHRCRWEKLS